MADGELLRVYFERRLEPGDLEHRLPYEAASSGPNGSSLVPGGWRPRNGYWESPEIVGRISRVREELRRLCGAGEHVLWGRLARPDGLGTLQPIVIPVSEWQRVRFRPKISGLRYLHFEYVAVEVRDAVALPPPAPAVDPPGRKLGRINVKARVWELMPPKADFERCWNALKHGDRAQVAREITGLLREEEGVNATEPTVARYLRELSGSVRKRKADRRSG
jgi:hypothetical protein